MCQLIWRQISSNAAEHKHLLPDNINILPFRSTPMLLLLQCSFVLLYSAEGLNAAWH